jgi:hypothetical protein
MEKIQRARELVFVAQLVRALLPPESQLLPVSSIYIWSKNFSHSVNEKSEAKMAAIDVQ